MTLDASGFAVTLADVELRLVAPDMVTEYIVTQDATDIRLVRGPLLQDVLTVKASLGSAFCSSANGTSTAIRDEWENWALMLYVRGVLKFDGPIVAGNIVWGGHFSPGQAYEHPGSKIELVAETWFTHECRHRYVATAGGAQYAKTDSPNAVFCDLIRTSIVSGAVVTPTDWQQGSEVRNDAPGPCTVACTAPTPAGDAIAYKQDVGVQLLDSLLELCNMPAAEADKLWPAQSRSGTTVTLSVLRGRSGVGRGIGTDHTATSASPIVVAAERANLAGYKFSFDRTQKENHLALTGKGRGGSQRRIYVADTGDVGNNGVYEGWGNLPAAGTDEELVLEAQRILTERVRGLRTHEFTVQEADGFQWPTHFDIADTLTFVVPVGQLTGAGAVSPMTVETNIIGLEWSLVAPGPAQLKLTLGLWPPTPERDLGRSGGGGRGGRGGGGRPRQKSGESETDPDAIKAFLTVKADDGNSAVADVYNDEISLLRYDANTYVRTYSRAGDDPEVITHMIEGDYVATPVDTTGYVKLRRAGGGDIYLAATTTDPGG